MNGEEKFLKELHKHFSVHTCSGEPIYKILRKLQYIKEEYPKLWKYFCNNQGYSNKVRILIKVAKTQDSYLENLALDYLDEHVDEDKDYFIDVRTTYVIQSALQICRNSRTNKIVQEYEFHQRIVKEHSTITSALYVFKNGRKYVDALEIGEPYLHVEDWHYIVDYLRIAMKIKDHYLSIPCLKYLSPLLKFDMDPVLQNILSGKYPDEAVILLTKKGRQIQSVIARLESVSEAKSPNAIYSKKYPKEDYRRDIDLLSKCSFLGNKVNILLDQLRENGKTTQKMLYTQTLEQVNKLGNMLGERKTFKNISLLDIFKTIPGVDNEATYKRIMSVCKSTNNNAVMNLIDAKVSYLKRLKGVNMANEYGQTWVIRGQNITDEMKREAANYILVELHCKYIYQPLYREVVLSLLEGGE